MKEDEEEMMAEEDEEKEDENEEEDKKEDKNKEEAEEEEEGPVCTSFEELPGLQPWLLTQLKQLKIRQPTPVQQHCIPAALSGQDVIGAAKTGSGKTLAFVLPILQHLSQDTFGIHTLVLTPTRELAFQISDQFRGVGGPMNVCVSVVVGGMDAVAQGRELSRSPHIVVATPGRLADLLTSSPDFTLKRIKFLVLDEADKLMDGRFDGQLGTVWPELPPRRQTLLFSATITHRLQRMKELAASEVFVWCAKGAGGETGRGRATVVGLDERYSLVNPIVKDAVLIASILQHTEQKPGQLVLVFTDTCKRTQVLKMLLQALGIESVSLHSMMPQKERLAALARFKSSQVKVMIATDLASRGLDIPQVGLVINHNVPSLPKLYIHRVGRTARAGRRGMAITLATPHDIKRILAIEGETRRKMEEMKVDEPAVGRIMKQVNVTRRIQEIHLDQTDFEERRNINKRKRLILEGKDPEEEERKKKKKQKKIHHMNKIERRKIIEKLKGKAEGEEGDGRKSKQRSSGLKMLEEEEEGVRGRKILKKKEEGVQGRKSKTKGDKVLKKKKKVKANNVTI